VVGLPAAATWLHVRDCALLPVQAAFDEAFTAAKVARLALGPLLARLARAPAHAGVALALTDALVPRAPSSTPNPSCFLLRIPLPYCAGMGRVALHAPVPPPHCAHPRRTNAHAAPAG